MNKIEFIPLIELPTKKDKDSEIYPSGTYFTNPTEWDLYQIKELKKNYANIPNPISSGIYQYRLFDITFEDLESVIRLHISDLDINNSCSLFGGYAISIDGKVELFPQCCGLLEEIQDWRKILNEKFEEFYLKECHPSPLISKFQNEIKIFCNGENEEFIPKTREVIILNYAEAKLGLIKTLRELEEYSNRLNQLSTKFGVKNIADIIIWGKNA